MPRTRIRTRKRTRSIDKIKINILLQIFKVNCTKIQSLKDKANAKVKVKAKVKAKIKINILLQIFKVYFNILFLFQAGEIYKVTVDHLKISNCNLKVKVIGPSSFDAPGILIQTILQHFIVH